MKENFNFKKFVIIALFVTLLLEVTVFNFRFYQSLTYDEITDYRLSYNSSDFEDLGENTYKFLSNRGSIEILDINEKVNSIRIDAEMINTSQPEKKKIEVLTHITDEANTLYKSTQKRYIVHDVPISQYLKLNTSGISEKIKLEFSGEENKEIKIHSLEVNTVRPFNFSIIRVLIVFFVLILAYALKKGSPVYDYKMDFGLGNQTYIIFALVVLQLLFLLHLTTRSPIWQDPPYSWHSQYREITRNITEGQFYLDEEPPQALIDMENPYDTNYRDKVMSENGVGAAWDRAYYDGHYYVYFGLTPIITLFLPYYSMTGEDLPNNMAVFIYLAIFSISAFLLIKEIIRKWFKQTPFIFYAIFTLFFINCSNTLMLATRPDLYAIPIAGAIAFTTLGLYLWISSIRETGVIWYRVLSGSLSMALVAGCRPQLVLISFVAIILFWNKTFKDRIFFSKKGILNTVSLILPYVIVAAVIMYYNYARFGNVFDFGANYNLTTNDMTKRGIVFDRTFTGIFYSLFQLPEIIANFPFFKDTHIHTNYLGTTIHEAMYGGFISCNVLVFSIFFIGRFKEILKNKGLYAFTLFTIISAFVITVADAQIAGILSRYLTDFGFLFMLSTIIILLCLIEKSVNKEYKNTVYEFIIIGCTLSFVYYLCAMNVENSLSISNQNVPLFYKIYHTVQFWL